MRVRPKTSVLSRRPTRRAHVAPRRVAPPTPEPVAEAVVLSTEQRRARESGGPMDRAEYSCACGMVFQADVSTSVACPHCSTTQAW